MFGYSSTGIIEYSLKCRGVVCDLLDMCAVERCSHIYQLKNILTRILNRIGYKNTISNEIVNCAWQLFL